MFSSEVALLAIELACTTHIVVIYILALNVYLYLMMLKKIQ